MENNLENDLTEATGTAGTETMFAEPAEAAPGTPVLFINGSKENIFKPIQNVSGVVQKKQPLPILSNILLAQENENVTFTATDLDIQIRTSSAIGTPNCRVSTTISSRKLNDILASLVDNSEVSFTKKGEHVLLTSGRSRFELQTLPAEDFPSMKEVKLEKAFSMPCSRFKYLLSMVSFACAVNNVRYFLNGVYICSEGTSVRAVATDGHRLALCDVDADHAYEKKLYSIITRKNFNELTRLVPDSEDEITVYMAEKQIKFTFAGVEILSKLVEGRYPDYQKVIPVDNDKEFKVSRQELLSSLQRVSILTADKLKGVRWNLSSGVINVAATNADMEEAEDELEVEYQGDSIEIGFNVTYLIEVLNALKNETVRVSLGGPLSSALIRMPDSEKFKFVVMPMKI